ncbi:hypothetical protein [Halomonas sp. PR-M31]|uniref:hypothetical protein n=1 Tax=Halomonas sp. PR-M31 TaxID=1471202 RepID=UPI0006525972|nr:hypothetical protein [Halomonas sp. PR-M31]
MSKRRFHGLILPAFFLILGGPVLAQDDCTPIDFEPEADSTVIADMILPEQTLCYQLITEADQQVSLQVLEDDNISALLQDPMDPQKFPHVPSDQHAYQILVKQIKRTVTPQYFRVAISVEP